MKRLVDLNPEWGGFTRPKSGEVLAFDCPVCPPEVKHRLVAALARPIDGGPVWPHHGQTWRHEGETFETLTLAPSVDYPGHWHGWIEDGQVIGANEATHYVLDASGKPVSLSPRQVRAIVRRGVSVGPR